MAEDSPDTGEHPPEADSPPAATARKSESGGVRARVDTEGVSAADIVGALEALIQAYAMRMLPVRASPPVTPIHITINGGHFHLGSGDNVTKNKTETSVVGGNAIVAVDGATVHDVVQTIAAAALPSEEQAELSRAVEALADALEATGVASDEECGFVFAKVNEAVASFASGGRSLIAKAGAKAALEGARTIVVDVLDRVSETVAAQLRESWQGLLAVVKSTFLE